MTNHFFQDMKCQKWSCLPLPPPLLLKEKEKKLLLTKVPIQTKSLISIRYWNNFLFIQWGSKYNTLTSWIHPKIMSPKSAVLNAKVVLSILHPGLNCQHWRLFKNWPLIQYNFAWVCLIKSSFVGKFKLQVFSSLSFFPYWWLEVISLGQKSLKKLWPLKDWRADLDFGSTNHILTFFQLAALKEAKEELEPRFFLFYWYTSTVTSTSTTITKTTTFTLALCTPASIAYSLCG